MLNADELTKAYARTKALNGFTLTVAAGEIAGLVGHNGAGKTTFAAIVAGLIRPDTGQVTVGGLPPQKAHHLLGLAPQQLALYPTATVRETLRLFGGLAGFRRGQLSKAVTDIADELRLGDVLDRRVGVLSGGQQRRTQAATAMLHRPALLLLDEPTVGADPETRQALLDAVKARATDGAAILYTTHYLPELTELGATLAVARKGRVIARGTAGELLHDLPGEVRLRFARRDELRVPTTDPTATLADLIPRLSEPLTGIDVRTPSLDDLYRAVAS